MHMYILQLQLRRLKLLKIFRCYYGGYEPNYEQLMQRHYCILRKIGARLIIMSNSSHGFGQIKGTTKKQNAIYPNVQVCLFRRNDRQLLWETTSRPDGSYAFRNISAGMECFVVGFDPVKQLNIVSQDSVVPK